MTQLVAYLISIMTFISTPINAKFYRRMLPTPSINQYAKPSSKPTQILSVTPLKELCIPQPQDRPCMMEYTDLWYYDPQTKKCYQPHAKCSGTSFETQEECQNICTKTKL